MRRSPWPRCLLNELTPMFEPCDKALSEAIATISKADPIIKLLQQVEQGRIKPTDAGLRAITESWLATYLKVIETAPMRRSAMMRLDPRPRIDLLIEAGVLDPGNEAGRFLRTGFEKRLAQTPSN